MKYYKKITLKDGTACVLRSGTEEDAPAVLRNFILTHGQTEFLTTYPDETSITLEQEREYLRGKVESPFEVSLLAEVDGVVAGTAGVDRIGAAVKLRHRASFGISIDEAWWGRGIGKALTEACIECAAAAGYLQLELEVVADNERALRLYRGAGFKEYGRNPKGFRTRDGRWQENVFMALDLEARAQKR
ncbi:MAG: GNAT family N-acetyltransferase [Clostridia bacterium]|nr:GNAT family N-acetyltransferase [Clostridia bacterium]